MDAYDKKFLSEMVRPKDATFDPKAFFKDADFVQILDLTPIKLADDITHTPFGTPGTKPPKIENAVKNRANNPTGVRGIDQPPKDEGLSGQ